MSYGWSVTGRDHQRSLVLRPWPCGCPLVFAMHFQPFDCLMSLAVLRHRRFSHRELRPSAGLFVQQFSWSPQSCVRHAPAPPHVSSWKQSSSGTKIDRLPLSSRLLFSLVTFVHLYERESYSAP